MQGPWGPVVVLLTARVVGIGLIIGPWAGIMPATRTRFSDATPGENLRGTAFDEGRGAMRALDCRAPDAHDDMHFAAQNDQDLVEQVQQDRDQYHADITDDQIKELAATSAYDE
jgi:hypothetical protein